MCIKSMSLLIGQTFVVILVTIAVSEPKPVPGCDIKARNETCPDGFCCVRDEFLFTETYCRRYGTEGSNCGTRPSEFECPCREGYQCASNIQGHVTSLFGKCYQIPGYTTPTDVESNSTDSDLTTLDYQLISMETTTQVDFTTTDLQIIAMETTKQVAKETTDSSYQNTVTDTLCTDSPNKCPNIVPVIGVGK